MAEFDLLQAANEGRESQEITAEDIMTHDPICVDETAGVDEITNIMTEHNVIRVPVVRCGNLVAVISRLDVYSSHNDFRIKSEAKLSE
ncbi:MAG: CBS domain-containing protein [Candidatus Scalindua sp.]|nr:CBS domain-containing protein [Candidatus Scalindua sp.]